MRTAQTLKRRNVLETAAVVPDNSNERQLLILTYKRVDCGDYSFSNISFTTCVLTTAEGIATYRCVSPSRFRKHYLRANERGRKKAAGKTKLTDLSSGCALWPGWLL